MQLQNARRTRVERGIYRQPNGKYAVCCRHAGVLRFRTVGFDLDAARRERAALIAAVKEGKAPVSPRLRFETVASWWLDRFEAKVAVGERRPRTLEAHRYHLECHLLPALARYQVALVTVNGSPSCWQSFAARAVLRRPPPTRSRRCRASCATRGVMTGSAPIRLSCSSARSDQGRGADASACLAVPRSSACLLPVRRAGG